MIYDDLENLANYGVFTEEATNKICNFMANLNVDIEEGKHIIDGDKIFASVQNYTTKDFGSSDLEIHKKYVDIQLLLLGEESVYYSSIDGLEETQAYDNDRDCAFYKLNEKSASIINLQVGKFAIFLPLEGHMPCIDSYAGEKCEVKKIVVKISTDLLKS